MSDKVKFLAVPLMLSIAVLLMLGTVYAQLEDGFVCKSAECIEPTNVFLTTEERVYVLIYFSEVLQLEPSWR